MMDGSKSGIIGGDDREKRRKAELYATDQQVRDARPLEAVTEAIERSGVPLAQIVATIMAGYADRPALGERVTELVTDPATGRCSRLPLPRFDTISYRELWARAGAIAAEWRQHTDSPLRVGEFVGVLGFASADYVMVDLACVRLGAVSVPLQASASARQLMPIIGETEPRILASSAQLLDTAVECALRSTSVRRVIVFGYHPDVDDERERFDAARERMAGASTPIALESLTEVIGRGENLPPVSLFEGQDGRLAMLLYTSGSTGTPKGARYTDHVMRLLWHRTWRPRPIDLPMISVVYTPLSHLVGQTILLSTLAAGGTAYFPGKSDLSTLFEDFRLVRPTEVLLVPRISEMIHQMFQREVDLRATDSGERHAVMAVVRNEFRERLFGGRVAFAISSAAPLAAEVTAFLEECLDLPLHDVYGSTEAGVALVDGRIATAVVDDYKLADLPELGYFSTDVPHPRGELLVKTKLLVPGYFKRPDVTVEVFDEDGFYRTGDIMAQVGPGELCYIDRCKNVLKLSQGEFVVLSRLETLFAASPVVQQIFVHGNSERAYLLAVVVPTKEAVADAGGAVDDLKARLAESLALLARDAGLNSYEIPRDFLIETDPFSIHNGLLSDSRKLLRPKVRDRYGDQLEQLYVELAEGETNELDALRHIDRGQPTLDIVMQAARTLLGSRGAALRPDSRFTDAGGDSMSALSLATLLEEIFAIEVPVGVVISPASDLRQLGDYIERALASGAKRPTFSSVHGAGATEVRAADLTLDTFVDIAIHAASAVTPPTDLAHTVLLTGANGYLGRFLCLEWLERLARTGGTLICVVRGSDAHAARARLDAALDSGDSELTQRFQELAQDHLEVIAGDVSEPDLGLDEQTWHRLADTVDLIVHAAALVNHVLPYWQLFGPNVVGTAELIKLAITTRIKPVSFLSSVTALATDVTAAEDADILLTDPVRTLDHGYANGYGASKWAGEILLREAHDRWGLPVTVFRSDLILAHSRYAGQLNVPDMFTRLLVSLITTGIAPRSFYRPGADSTARAHHTGLPVDFVASAIVALSDQNNGHYRTFNVLNPHDDGISLDVLVDWLAEAGHTIHRIDNYQEWFDRFGTVLRALPERLQQYSALPLLHAFAEPQNVVAGSSIPADLFRAAVREVSIGADQDIPHLSQSLISKYASDLHQLGLGQLMT